MRPILHFFKYCKIGVQMYIIQIIRKIYALVFVVHEMIFLFVIFILLKNCVKDNRMVLGNHFHKNKIHSIKKVFSQLGWVFVSLQITILMQI